MPLAAALQLLAAEFVIVYANARVPNSLVADAVAVATSAATQVPMAP
jgi:hypothetical protein